MVQNRGIDISIISQFDIQRLPEFTKPRLNDTNERNVVDCYVPIYPGSQIWFEYTVEPPHPPNAAYFFRLFINNQAVIAWDCTEKCGYHGKMIYILEKIESQRPYPGTYFQRKGFRFRNVEDAPGFDREAIGDSLEVRVYRIEHRQRIRDLRFACDEETAGQFGHHIELINGGFLEPGRPQRRYKYQLLDPTDEPYAVFRFHCRTYEYLRDNSIILASEASSNSSLSASTSWCVTQPVATTHLDDVNKIQSGWEMQTASEAQTVRPQSNSPKTARTGAVYSRNLSPARSQISSGDVYLPLSDSDESLSAVARDSIEDIPSTVTRSTESQHCQQKKPTQKVELDASPTRKPLSPRRKLKKYLTIDLEGATSGTETKKRPLSPFTSGGFLRRLASPVQPTPTPATIFPLGPGITQEQGAEAPTIKRRGSKRKGHQQTSTLSQTGDSGLSIMRFLSRRGSRRG